MLAPISSIESKVTKNQRIKILENTCEKKRAQITASSTGFDAKQHQNLCQNWEVHFEPIGKHEASDLFNLMLAVEIAE